MNRTSREKKRPLRFKDIPQPKMLCLILANGGGTKLFQSYLDNHSQLYNIPAYPLLYFYPHWNDWKTELVNDWNWDAIKRMKTGTKIF